MKRLLNHMARTTMGLAVVSTRKRIPDTTPVLVEHVPDGVKFSGAKYIVMERVEDPDSYFGEDWVPRYRPPNVIDSTCEVLSAKNHPPHQAVKGRGIRVVR
jgi:hypothetical protein